MVWASETSKLTHSDICLQQGHTPYSFQNSPTNQGPNFQLYDSMGVIVIQTTTIGVQYD